jgi:hypothetical protein
MASARISTWTWTWTWQLGMLCAAACGVAATPAAAQPAYQVDDLGHVTEHAAPPPADQPRGASDTALAAPVGARMRPGVLPALGALVPGLAVHGTGHFIGGDARTGRRLMLAQGIGLATAAAGAVPLALTGASDNVSTFSLPLVVAGTGMFMLGWAADVYGSAGGPRLAGAPALMLPGSEVGLGYLYVRDPRFAYTSFVDMDALVRAGAWRLEGAAALAVDDDNQRVRLRAGYRFLGPRPARRAATGTALDLMTAVTVHRYGTDGFTTVTSEVGAHGRLDLAQLSSSLAGAFVEGDLGLGLDRAAYRHAPADTVGILVGRFGFGMYLGHPAATHGELQLFYDHRRDGLVGGLATRRFNGILGSFGFQGALTVRRGMGVAIQAQAGSAYLLGIGLRYARP